MSLKNYKNMQKGKRTKKRGIKMQKEIEKIFPTQKNFLENPSMCMPLFNPYAPMHKFCTCYIDL